MKNTVINKQNPDSFQLKNHFIQLFYIFPLFPVIFVGSIQEDENKPFIYVLERCSLPTFLMKKIKSI